ncbi:MAG: ZapG family protein [Myxococcota bacterium]
MNLGFDPNLLWAAAAGLAVGAALVFLLMRRGGSVNRERAESLATELEETQLELEGHREEVAKHFSQTSDLFRDLTEQYSRLYAHLATGARDFCPDEVPSLGHGLDTPPLVDEAVQARYGEDAAERSPEGEPEQPAEAEAEAPAAAADEPARAEAAEPEEGERMAVDAPVPGAAPPPVGKKANGGSHLTH